MEEIWKNIPEYEGLYQASNLGRIRNIHRLKTLGGILRPILDTGGHLQIGLYKNSKQKRLLIHRLILKTFISPCPSEMECRHLDGNPVNNKLNNLKWGTRSENQQDSIRHGTFFHPNNSGSNNGHAILQESDVHEIRELLQSGRNGRSGQKYSQREISKMFNVHRYTISMIATRKTWRYLR